MTSSDGSVRPGADPVRITLRPLGSAVPLGFFVFGTGMAVLGGIGLGWIPIPQVPQAGVLLLTFVAPLELIAAVFAFLSRDGLAGTGLGVFAGSWATVGVQYLVGRPGSTSVVLGLYLLTFAAVVLLLGVIATNGQLLLAVILFVAAVRTLLAGLYELPAATGLQTAAGTLSLAITVLAFYGAAALLLEDTAHRTVLPLGRRNQARTALDQPLAQQTEQLEQEAGVRRNL
ncbi:GPR1/FUN34/yaaH family protein [Blastococcus sp. DSM 46786]|uniref:GPR1/FUN34/YaaH family transporter n=1 Tax=Blastococcus sp. DSM 46786 TaxID=1798227 RepID=UPI0008B6CD52|nr:GPR1/FUN34/YaaH family transporter [Blastococcus sp. DSM 46786]SEL95241.1 GPR1/FUN34/yaaH family protein [Blastococcus sp. DSM 46786]